jgi:hypothetical protein
MTTIFNSEKASYAFHTLTIALVGLFTATAALRALIGFA